MKNKKNILSLIIIFIVFMVVFIIMILNINNTKDKKPVTIVEEISIMSSVQNVLLQTYTSNITGIIKNNTDEPIVDTVIKFYVETNYLHNKGIIETNPFTIPANSEYVLEFSFNTTENFETITSMTVSASGIEPTSLTKDKNNYNFITYILILLLCVIIGIFICISGFKGQKETLNYNQANSKHVSITQVTEPKEFFYCEYCGTKNTHNSLKCTSCGAKLNNVKK